MATSNSLPVHALPNYRVRFLLPLRLISPFVGEPSLQPLPTVQKSFDLSVIMALPARIVTQTYHRSSRK